MGLDESRIVVLDVVASVASGMPVYYPVPDTKTRDAHVFPIATMAASSASSPFQRLWAVIRTQLTPARG